MGKTTKGKDKAKAKVAKANAKIARKVKRGVAAVVAAFALALLATGCTSAQSSQPAKSQTQSNTFDGCIIVVATQASVSNRVIRADGTKDIPAVELFTMAQSQESKDSTDTFGQSATQTPTTDIKPKTDLRYNDAIGAGGTAAKSFMDSLSSAGVAMVSDYIKNKKSGTIEVEKKDGTKETVTCENGKCTTSDGTVLDENTCKDCIVK
ncbi:MAG: hypothetical protein IKO55_08150 [Kiritimatiellae bacterium]|nr:hypothetical protein [Kiritimatiellia bacterium]